MSDADYEDDKSIRDECELLRRVQVRPDISIVLDENLGRWRPSSAAFRDHRNGSPMSVVLRDDLENENRSLEEILHGHEGFALASITAGFARQCNQKIVRDPLPDEPAHAHVIGNKKKVSRKMAKEAVWIFEPNVPAPQSLIK